jgi:hypothetical protein
LDPGQVTFLRPAPLLAVLASALTAAAATGLTAQAAPKPATKVPVQKTVTATATPTAAVTSTTTSPSASATPSPATASVTATATTTTPTATATPTAIATVASSPSSTLTAAATALLPKPTLVAPIARALTPASPGITLDTTRDYVITIPSGSVFTKPVTILGGHNVVLEAAVLRYAAPAGSPADWTVRGLMLKGQTGVMWIRDLQIRGPLAEGIDLEQKAPGAAVVLRDIAIDQVSGTYETNHADLLQTWAGPDKLVVDGLSGSSNYQGMFLRPNDLWADGPTPTLFALSNVTIDVSTGYYALWTDGFGAFPLTVSNVQVRPNPARPSRDAWLWPKPSTGDTTWVDVVGLL